MCDVCIFLFYWFLRYCDVILCVCLFIMIYLMVCDLLIDLLLKFVFLVVVFGCGVVFFD